MTTSNLIEIGMLAAALAGVGWQIRRDRRKDRDEQLTAAIKRAQEAVRLEERVRRLEEERPADEAPDGS